MEKEVRTCGDKEECLKIQTDQSFGMHHLVMLAFIQVHAFFL